MEGWRDGGNSEFRIQNSEFRIIVVRGNKNGPIKSARLMVFLFYHKLKITMSKNANFTGQPIFSQLLKFIPKEKTKLIIRKHNSDHYVKTFTTYDHLVTMLYGSFH